MPTSPVVRREFLDTLERHVDFDRIDDLVGPDTPQLVIGTVDINDGEFETFTCEQITPEAVLASAAVPTLFEAVEIDGHYHWDGLFSQNPPIYDLMHVPPARKPDEHWVIQINPQTREGEPTSVEDIVDRRNELSGNISLNQELRFVETVNDWLDRGHLPSDQYTHT
jgi:NTE family protein